jgi:hypothetical protein
METNIPKTLTPFLLKNGADIEENAKRISEAHDHSKDTAFDCSVPHSKITIEGVDFHILYRLGRYGGSDYLRYDVHPSNGKKVLNGDNLLLLIEEAYQEGLRISKEDKDYEKKFWEIQDKLEWIHVEAKKWIYETYLNHSKEQSNLTFVNRIHDKAFKKAYVTARKAHHDYETELTNVEAYKPLFNEVYKATAKACWEKPSEHFDS